MDRARERYQAYEQKIAERQEAAVRGDMEGYQARDAEARQSLAEARQAFEAGKAARSTDETVLMDYLVVLRALGDHDLAAEAADAAIDRGMESAALLRVPARAARHRTRQLPAGGGRPPKIGRAGRDQPGVRAGVVRAGPLLPGELSAGRGGGRLRGGPEGGSRACAVPAGRSGGARVFGGDCGGRGHCRGGGPGRAALRYRIALDDAGCAV